jgi:transposase
VGATAQAAPPRTRRRHRPTHRRRITRHEAKIDRAKLAELVEQRPDATLLELADLLGVTCVKSAVWKALRQLKLSYKKSRSAPPSRTGRTSWNVGPRGA